MEIYLIHILKQREWLTPPVLAVLAAAAIAFLASLIAYRQVLAMTRQMRITTLLSLDERWESDSMLGTREDLSHLVQKTEADAENQWHGLSNHDKRLRTRELYANELHSEQKTDAPKYLRICRVIGFFETVGHVCRSRYLPVPDITNLLGGAIEMVGEVFENHINKLRGDGQNPEMYANFIWLLEKSRDWSNVRRGTHPRLWSLWFRLRLRFGV